MKYEIKSKKRACCWEEGYFTGNGTIGAIVMCEPENEKIIFNHEELFLHTTELENFPNMSDIFLKMREAYRKNEQVEYACLFFEEAVRRGLKNKIFKEDKTLYPDSFFPAFELDINYEIGCVSNYQRSIDTSTGEITAAFEENGNKVVHRIFTSHIQNAVFANISSQTKKDISFKAVMVKPKNEREKMLTDTCIKKISTEFDKNTYCCRVQMNKGFYDFKIVFLSDGKGVYEEGQINFKNASYVTAAVLIEVNNEADSTIITSYEEAFDENKEIYKEQFFRTMIEFEENEDFDGLSEELFLEPEKKQAAIMQKLYYMGRYLAISSFGKLPPNAQGLWSGNIDGRMLCDYISNIELEMALWAIFSGGFTDKAMNCFDFIESFTTDFEENAKKIFGAKGIMVTSRFTNSGLLFHFSQQYTHQFWIAGGAWLAQTYFEYYRYTLDKDFLKNRALPFMRKTADFYMDYIKDKNIIPSVSPENTPYSDLFCMAGKNAAMDIAAIKELFTNIDKACKILNIKNEYSTEICDYSYSSDGALKEWSDNSAANAYSHRHISHAYAAMPGEEALYNIRLKNGIKRAMEKRIENGFYSEENGTCGWSVMHLINVFARLEEKEKVSEAMRFFTEHYLRENFTACLNYSRTMFQIDANLGYINALYEMLIYTSEDELVLLPGLPDFLKRGRASGLLLRGNRKILEMVWNENEIALKIFSGNDGFLKVRADNKTVEMKLCRNEISELLLERQKV